MNLDNKYSRLQVYNKRLLSPGDNAGSHEADDENDLADFLSDLPPDRVQLLTGQSIGKSEQRPESVSSAFISDYELVVKQLL